MNKRLLYGKPIQAAPVARKSATDNLMNTDAFKQGEEMNRVATKNKLFSDTKDVTRMTGGFAGRAPAISVNTDEFDTINVNQKHGALEDLARFNKRQEGEQFIDKRGTDEDTNLAMKKAYWQSGAVPNAVTGGVGKTYNPYSAERAGRASTNRKNYHAGSDYDFTTAYSRADGQLADNPNASKFNQENIATDEAQRDRWYRQARVARPSSWSYKEGGILYKKR